MSCVHKILGRVDGWTDQQWQHYMLPLCGGIKRKFNTSVFLVIPLCKIYFSGQNDIVSRCLNKSLFQ